jgi:tetratricopeptide (TPR) repeat protein
VHLVVIVAALAVLQAHSHPAPALASLTEIVNRPLPLRSGIGSAHDTVSTSSKRAQDFYDQGLAYLHSFVWLEAARSFNEALRADPKLAMAHLGLTIAYTELNAPAAARTALEHARALGAAAGDHDRRHIAARALQAEAESAPGGSLALQQYRTALDAALKAFPEDEELWLLRGLAESPDPANRGQGSVAESIPFYQKALALAPAHFAAHHYLTHAYENTGRIAQALAEGTEYAKMAPSVPHAPHRSRPNSTGTTSTIWICWRPRISISARWRRPRRCSRRRSPSARRWSCRSSTSGRGRSSCSRAAGPPRRSTRRRCWPRIGRRW